VAGKVAVPHRAAGGCLQLIIYHLERRLSSAGECRIIALSEITEPMEKQTGAALHGLFTLVAGVSEQEFLLAFEAFYGHLKEREFVRGYRMMRRQPLEGFGAALPDFDYHVEIEFLSLEQDTDFNRAFARCSRAGRSRRPRRAAGSAAGGMVEWLFLRQFTVDRIMAQLGKLNPSGQAT
jgi:hypothetical protein